MRDGVLTTTRRFLPPVERTNKGTLRKIYQVLKEAANFIDPQTQMEMCPISTRSEFSLSWTWLSLYQTIKWSTGSSRKRCHPPSKSSMCLPFQPNLKERLSYRKVSGDTGTWIGIWSLRLRWGTHPPQFRKSNPVFVAPLAFKIVKKD